MVTRDMSGMKVAKISHRDHGVRHDSHPAKVSEHLHATLTGAALAFCLIAALLVGTDRPFPELGELRIGAGVVAFAVRSNRKETVGHLADRGFVCCGARTGDDIEL